MTLPLRDSDIAKITNVIRDNPQNAEDLDIQVVRKCIVYAAIDPLTHPERVPAAELAPLRSRLHAYLDYYAAYLLAENAESEQDRRFLNTLRWGGAFWGTSLGLYLAAKYQLAPSSVMKLFKEHIDNTGFGWVARGLVKNVGKNVQDAYYQQGKYALPKDIHPYLHYHPDHDRQVAKRITQRYSDKNRDGNFEDSPFSHQEAREYIDKLMRYRGLLRADSSQGGVSDVQYILGDNSPFDYAIALSRFDSSSVSKCVTLVLKSINQPYHLTLELFGNQRLLYGIPPEVLKKIPHIEEQLVRDIVKPIVDALVRKNPELQPKQTSIPALVERCTRPTPQKDNEDQEEIEVNMPQKPPKRKQLATALHLVTTKPQPEEPELANTNPALHTVIYTEASVRKMMGKRPKEADVQLVLETLKKVEMGAVRKRKVVSREDSLRVRAGDWRIIFEIKDGEPLEVSEIERRPKAYKQKA